MPVAVPPAVRRHALAHEHARARRGLEHVVDALDLERAALLVRARADRGRDALRLLARDEGGRVGRAGRRAQVGLAADEDDGDRRAADGADFFYPLWVGVSQRG